MYDDEDIQVVGTGTATTVIRIEDEQLGEIYVTLTAKAFTCSSVYCIDEGSESDGYAHTYSDPKWYDDWEVEPRTIEVDEEGTRYLYSNDGISEERMNSILEAGWMFIEDVPDWLVDDREWNFPIKPEDWDFK